MCLKLYVLYSRLSFLLVFLLVYFIFALLVCLFNCLFFFVFCLNVLLVLLEHQPSQRDLEFPPGFGPASESLDGNAELLCDLDKGTRTIKVEPEQCTLRDIMLSDALTDIQETVENSLFVSAKPLLFKYFEEILQEEMTKFFCSALKEKDEVS